MCIYSFIRLLLPYTPQSTIIGKRFREPAATARRKLGRKIRVPISNNQACLRISKLSILVYSIVSTLGETQSEMQRD